MFKHHCRRLISVFELAFLQCKILLLWHGTKSMNLDTMPCVTGVPSGRVLPGNPITALHLYAFLM